MNETELPAVAGPVERGVRRPASLTATLLRAAQLLDREAAALRACHTVRGRWQADDEDARAAYDEMRTTAKQLRKAHNYMAVNPLGGPAKALDACADSIRAGDPMDFAMANFGLAWAPNVRANLPP